MNHIAEGRVDLLQLARDGEFGTPESPNRSSGPKCVFWQVFFGQRKASEFRNDFSYPWARAGEAYAKEV